MMIFLHKEEEREVLVALGQLLQKGLTLGSILQNTEYRIENVVSRDVKRFTFCYNVSHYVSKIYFVTVSLHF